MQIFAVIIDQTKFYSFWHHHLKLDILLQCIVNIHFCKYGFGIIVKYTEQKNKNIQYWFLNLWGNIVNR